MTIDLARLKALPLPLHIDEEFNIVDVNKKVILQTAYIDLLDGWITKDLVNALNALPEMISELEALRGENAKLKATALEMAAKLQLADNACPARTQYEWCDDRQKICDGWPSMWEKCPRQKMWLEMAEEALKRLLEAQ